MNRNSRDVIYGFGNTKNRAYLQSELNKFFDHPRVQSFLNTHIHSLVDNFIDTIEQELELSDPIPGITVADQVECYNCQFMNDRIDYIRMHVIGDDAKIRYTVNDGAPTSRFGQRHHNKNANKMLETWNMNPGRGVQLREDSQGASNCNPYTGYGDSHVVSGVEFCDQSDVNTSNHVEQLLGTSYMIALNRDSQPHTATGFGNADPANDDRLLSRRIFRKNESGVENGIPNYRRRIHGRNLERDIRDTLQGVERDCIVHGHDMSSLLARTEHKKIITDKYGSTNGKMKLYNNKTYDEDAQYK